LNKHYRYALIPLPLVRLDLFSLSPEVSHPKIQMNQTDFVTFFVQQGATPYNITLPTGNSQIRYANGVSTVTGVANTTVQINITGVFNYNTSANNYLVTVNSAFS
jgi:hypothetical protein